MLTPRQVQVLQSSLYKNPARTKLPHSLLQLKPTIPALSRLYILPFPESPVPRLCRPFVWDLGCGFGIPSSGMQTKGLPGSLAPASESGTAEPSVRNEKGRPLTARARFITPDALSLLSLPPEASEKPFSSPRRVRCNFSSAHTVIVAPFRAGAGEITLTRCPPPRFVLLFSFPLLPPGRLPPSAVRFPPRHPPLWGRSHMTLRGKTDRA